jgi:hypothetical protein
VSPSPVGWSLHSLHALVSSSIRTTLDLLSYPEDGDKIFLRNVDYRPKHTVTSQGTLISVITALRTSEQYGLRVGVVEGRNLWHVTGTEDSLRKTVETSLSKALLSPIWTVKAVNMNVVLLVISVFRISFYQFSSTEAIYILF